MSPNLRSKNTVPIESDSLEPLGGMMAKSQRVTKTAQEKRPRAGHGPGSNSNSDSEEDGRNGGNEELENRLLNNIQERLPSLLPSLVTALLPSITDLIGQEVRKIVADVTNDTQRQIAEMHGKVQTMEKNIGGLTKTVTDLARDKKNLMEQVRSMAAQSARVSDQMDKESQRARAANLIISGLQDASSPTLDLKGKVESLFTEVPAGGIMSVERLGPSRSLGGNTRPPLVRVKFADDAAKHNAFKSSRDLRAKGVFLDGDLTPLQQENRRGKRERYHVLKQEGKRPFWRYDKLYIMQNGEKTEDSETARPTYASRLSANIQRNTNSSNPIPSSSRPHRDSSGPRGPAPMQA